MNKVSIRERLENWARWAGAGSGRQEGQSMTMTGIVCDRLRKAALGNVWSGVEPRSVLDDTDARQVEQAWCRLEPRSRELLRWWYVRRARPEFICRRLRIKPFPRSVFDLELKRAEIAIEKILMGMPCVPKS
jgi:hypothetical protein